ncbi:MAG: segregation/condensation protein A [Patescibacteria group bacterium]
MYQIQSQQFSGPIDKLLELIEGKKMAITDLSLAEVTASFLDYVRKLEVIEPRLVSDFVVIAAHLLLIKSKELLPSLELSSEEEQDISDLKIRLEKYKEFKEAIALFKKFYERKNFSVSRSLFANKTPVFYPSENISINSLNSSIATIFESFNDLKLDSETIEIVLVRLEEKIEEIVKKMESGIKSFGELSKEKSKTEIIVLFLALLHLLRDQIIKVEQGEKFSDIMITRNREPFGAAQD